MRTTTASIVATATRNLEGFLPKHHPMRVARAAYIRAARAHFGCGASLVELGYRWVIRVDPSEVIDVSALQAD